MLSRIVQGADLFALVISQTRVSKQQFRKPQDTVQWRAQFMRHACQELAFGFPSGARRITRCGQILHRALERRDIRSDADHATIRCAPFRNEDPAPIRQKPFHGWMIATVKGLALRHESLDIALRLRVLPAQRTFAHDVIK